MRRFLLGWFAATFFAASLKTIFVTLLWAFAFTTVVGQPPTGSDMPNALYAFLATVLSYSIDFLLAFAAASLISRRFPAARLGIFIGAGIVALIAPTLIFAGPRFLVLLWQNTLAEIVIGAVAGLMCGWIAGASLAAPTSA